MRYQSILFASFVIATEGTRYGLLRVGSPATTLTRDELVEDHRSLLKEDFQLAFRKLFGYSALSLSVAPASALNSSMAPFGTASLSMAPQLSFNSYAQLGINQVDAGEADKVIALSGNGHVDGATSGNGSTETEQSNAKGAKEELRAGETAVVAVLGSLSVLAVAAIVSKKMKSGAGASTESIGSGASLGSTDEL